MPEASKVKPFGAAERKISMRYLRAKKSQGGVGLIAAISFSCIALAIAAMIIIMSIMNGFRDEVIRLTVGSQGHMFVAQDVPNPSLQETDHIAEIINGFDRVERAFSFTQDFAGVAANGRLSAGQVTGISREALEGFDLITDNLVVGGLAGFGNEDVLNDQVIIGVGMAGQLGLTVGDKVTIFSGRTRASPFGPARPVIKDYALARCLIQGFLKRMDPMFIWILKRLKHYFMLAKNKAW